nr:hypothetical protein 13 [Elusimicrobiota bacterium]
MPAPDITEKYIRIRIKDPDLFIKDSFRTIDISESDGIKAIIGKLKTNPNGRTVIQSYLFDKERWDTEEAQRWVEEHGKSGDNYFGKNEIVDLSDDKEELSKMEIKPITKMYDCVLKEFDDQDRSFTATASTENKDRDGDILRTDGWKLKNFKRNPVILWAHNATILPVAKAEKVWVEEGKLKFKPRFVPKDINPFAEQVYQMYKAGFLRAFSVRFDPIKWADIATDENKHDQQIKYGRDYVSQELLEISAVNIPANPEALKSRDMQDLALKSYVLENASKIDDPQERERVLKGIIQVVEVKKDKPVDETDKQASPEITEKKENIPAKAIEQKEPVQENETVKKLKDRLCKLQELIDRKEQSSLEQVIEEQISQLEKELQEDKVITEIENRLQTILSGITALEQNGGLL